MLKELGSKGAAAVTMILRSAAVAATFFGHVWKGSVLYLPDAVSQPQNTHSIDRPDLHCPHLTIDGILRPACLHFASRLFLKEQSVPGQGEPIPLPYPRIRRTSQPDN
jgi:hypothetical protein